MKHSDPEQELNNLHNEKDALDQSIALNRIVLRMLDDKRRRDLWLTIALIVSILVNVVIVGMFIQYESQFTTTVTTTETTVEQDTGEGSGNNVYQAGENATYTQGATEEVEMIGETNGESENDYDHENSAVQVQ